MTMNARDPRPAASPEADIRPVVAGRQGPMTVWLAAGGVALGAVLLFNLLDGQRRARTAPTTTLAAAGVAGPSQALPPLYIPPETPGPPPPPEPPAMQDAGGAAPMAQVPLQPPPPQSPFAPQPPPPNYAPPPWLNEPQPSQAPPQMQASSSGASALVIDTTSSPRGDTGAEDGPTNGGAVRETGAVQTSRLTRRSSTVAQGTLIPAVLETALDSTRPGFARAIVSSDVRGFDGSRVLIPRGSRLFGEYQADLTAGQNRALVQWTRLVRPDGVSISIASPVADAQGRAGVRGRVDTHFLQRFGSALLQTTLNIGVAAASRSLSGDASVIVALPGSTQGGGSTVAPTNIQPTLRVDAGARVSVFVARDLEFPGGDAR
ncbi:MULTISPECIES: TrbI/VirB10 family protein [Brevundimonas]|uniref:TrbI/VirB10 family protein n=1 Tax=Brevundimonas TaxID=41275 RepID=UPI0018F4944A|nr:TrbI/VirB10 family protein [Brevundimonas sp. LPMIX5]